MYGTVRPPMILNTSEFLNAGSSRFQQERHCQMMVNRNTPIPLIPILAALALSCTPISVPPPDSRPDPPPAHLAPSSSHTLEGTFTAPQHQDGPRPVRAVFSAAEKEGLWNVVFHFHFNGAQHAFRGTAEGSLQEGPLHGTISSYQRRTFTFSGDLTKGVFSGTHAEVSRRGRRAGAPSTGTITLRAANN